MPGAKSVEQLRELCEYAEMPVIIKGVMTAQGAVKAADAGSAAIVVSNHGGRVLAGAAATAEVLPEIVEAVGGRVKIIVDGGIRSGTDIFPRARSRRGRRYDMQAHPHKLLRRQDRRHRDLRRKAPCGAKGRNVHVRRAKNQRYRPLDDTILVGQNARFK